MRKRGVFLVIALFAFLALIISSCSSGDQPSDQQKVISQQISSAKNYLYEGQYSAAKAKFGYVLTNYDPNNSQANFGYALSELLGFADLIRTVSGLTGSLSSMAEDENIFVRDVLHDLLKDLYDKFKDIDGHLFFAIADPNFEFILSKSTPVYLSASTTPTLDLQGEWDRADAFLLDGLSKALMGILSFTLSIDLRGNYLGAYDKITQIGMDNLSVSKIMNVIVYLFNDQQYPNFLGLDPDEGEARWKEAGLDLATAVQYIMYAFYFSSIETDNQDDDILAFYPTKPDGAECKKGEGGPYCSYESRVNMKNVDVCALPATTVTGKTVINIILDKDGKKKPIEMLNKAGTACVLKKIQESLDYTNGKDVKIYLITEILPVLIDSIKGLLPEDTASLIEASQLNTPEGLKNNLGLGDPIALDLGNFFENPPPKGLRGFFPAWDTSSKWEENFFVLEKECPNNNRSADDPFYLRALTDVSKDAGIGDILFPCNNPEDLPHFSFSYPGFPTIIKIPADGIKSKSIYIAFQDPSFNNMLYLNFDSDHMPPGANFDNPDLLGYGPQPANLYNLNALIQYYINIVSGFIK